jgi:hypothetical protein
MMNKACIPSEKQESNLSESMELLISKVCNCLGSTREIDNKLYNSVQGNASSGEEVRQPNMENSLMSLHALVDELASLLGYINRKL